MGLDLIKKMWKGSTSRKIQLRNSSYKPNSLSLYGDSSPFDLREMSIYVFMDNEVVFR